MTTIEDAKASFGQAKDGLLTTFAATPDDRLNWSPAPTARTPIQIVAHAASALAGIQGLLDGHPFDAPTPSEADRGFREHDRGFTTRDAVVSLFAANAAAYLAWLDALSPDRLATSVDLPFGFGEVPLVVALGFPTQHTAYHAAQLAYVQTIYGDQVWH